MLEKLRQPANCLCAMILAVFSLAISARAADEVLDWIHVMNDTVIAGGTNPLATSRTVALVSASVFDVVNGIEPRYDHFLVEGNPPRPASQRAAATVGDSGVGFDREASKHTAGIGLIGMQERL